MVVTQTTFAQDDFRIKILTTEANESFTIPTTGEGYDYTVNWGDGNVSLSQKGNSVHTYADAGMYTVSIWGTFPRIRFKADNNATKLQRIDHWGDLQWDTIFYAFEGCSNLILNADDAPDLSLVTVMSGMFKGTTQLTDIKDIDSSADANMCFYSDGVFQDQFFTACGGTSIADCTNVPGVQIIDDTYDSSGADAGTLNITEIEADTILLYPNPVSTSFYIKGLTTTSTVRIYDINGRVITEQNIQEDQAIDMSPFDDGVYLVEITTEITSVTKRLIKKSN